MKEETMYVTKDDKVFRTIEEAEAHELKLEFADFLYDRRIIGFYDRIDVAGEILEYYEITKRK